MSITFAISVSVLTALIIALVQVAKNLGLPTKYAPLLSCLLGLLCILGLSYFEATASVLITGLAVGLSAAGLFDLGTKTFENKQTKVK